MDVREEIYEEEYRTEESEEGEDHSVCFREHREWDVSLFQEWHDRAMQPGSRCSKSCDSELPREEVCKLWEHGESDDQ